MTFNLNVNGQPHAIEAEPDMPLLWVLREKLGLHGTKFGCGVGACGACTVHVEGEAVRSCSVSIDAVAGQHVTTIEGLPPPAPGTPHPVQAAWVAMQVPQCGYCQSGMIMAVTALLAKNPAPTDADIDAGLTNVCRCGTYPRIRRAIHALAKA
jgi:isoquinoline 1-oxidoreductase alpha subunit